MEHGRREQQGASDIGLLSEIDADIFAPANNAFNRVRQNGNAATSAPASSSSSSAPRPYAPAMSWGATSSQGGQPPSILGGAPNPPTRPFVPMEEASGGGAYRDTFTDESSMDALTGAPNRGAGGATAHASSSSTSDGAGGGDTTTDAKKRNREHARQTRIRKKAYVAQLERTLRELRRQAAAAVSSEEAQYAVVINDMREKGREFLSSFFGGELRPEVFSLLAVPDVRVWCPVTPFKSHPPQGSGSLYLDGIADIVADSQAWAVLLKDSLGIGSAAWCRARLSAASTDTTVWVDFVPSSARSNVLCGRWAVSSSNAAAPSDVIVSGMAMLTFRSTSTNGGAATGAAALPPPSTSSATASSDGINPSGLVRIENVELFFDVMSVMQQIHQAQFAGLNRAVVPNTVAMLGLVSEPHIVFKVDDRVFPISSVNEAFARAYLRSSPSSDGSSSSSTSTASSAVVGAPFAAIFADFTGLHLSLHAGMVERFIMSLRRRHCCAGVVSLRVPSEEASAHANGGNSSGGALGSSLAHVHLAMYPLWGNPTASSSSSPPSSLSSLSATNPNQDSSNPNEAAVTHYLALLVNLNQQLPQMRPHPAMHTQSGVRSLAGAAPPGAASVSGSGGNMGSAMAAQSK